MAQINSRFHRRYARFTDQHGRKWGAVVESTSGHPTGPVEFHSRTPAGNLPPWLPAANHLVFDATEVGQVTINYDSAIAEAERNIADYEQIIAKYAVAMYADKAAEQIENPGPGLLAIVGAKPKAPEIIRAAKAGNKWALGFSDAMPEWAKPFVAVVGIARPKREERQYPDADDEKRPAKGNRQSIPEPATAA